jgi:hypothetical protein
VSLREDFERLVATLPAMAVFEPDGLASPLSLRKKEVDLRDNVLCLQYTGRFGERDVVAATEVPMRLAAEVGADGVIALLGEIVELEARVIQRGARA